MAEYQITYWKEIPSMIMARAGRRDRHKVELPQRFQVAIDEAAMRLGMIGSDAYMESWVRGEWREREGDPQSVAAAVAAEIEADYPPARVREILDSYGPPSRGRVSARVNPVVAKLRSTGGPLMSDGAMGTMLQDAGLTDGGAPELWNVARPDVVKAIYQGYLDAGAQIISTNTFGGTSARLKLHQLQDRVHELNEAGVRLAKEVAEPVGALVAASIGPSGELIKPLGDLTMDEAAAIFAEQAEGLAAGGADLMLIETMSDLREVEAAVKGIQSVTDIPIMVTMTFDTNYHTMMGVSPAQAVTTLASWGVEVVGANCGNGPAEIQAVMTEMAQNRPEGICLMAQSNAGMPQYNKGVISYDGTPPVMADYAVTMRNLGVDIIGGCCGTTPDHLRAMAAALAQVKDDPIPGPPSAAGATIESDESRAARRDARRAARRGRE